jgi:hypothetical protein
MRATQPSSDLWDWPMSRTGQAAMALLGAAFIIPFAVPLFLWVASITPEGDAELGWVIMPVLIAAGLATISAVLALIAITIRRERSLYLAFPLLGALIVFLLSNPGG